MLDGRGHERGRLWTHLHEVKKPKRRRCCFPIQKDFLKRVVPTTL